MVSKNQILLISFLAFASSWRFFSHLEFSPQSLAAAETEYPSHGVYAQKRNDPMRPLSVPTLAKGEKQEKSKTPEQISLESICLLRELDSPFRPNSEDQYASIVGPSGNQVVILIKSPLCLEGNHSIVSAEKTDGRWRVQKSLDCRQTTSTEIYQNFFTSGKLTYLGQKSDQINLALNTTSADFLTLCDSGFVASRRGNFKLDEFELYRDQNGCLLMTQNMEPYRKDSSVKEIALIQTWSERQPHRELIEPGRVSVTLNTEDIPLLNPTEDSFLEGYVESFDHIAGSPLGIPDKAFKAVDFDNDCSF